MKRKLILGIVAFAIGFLSLVPFVSQARTEETPKCTVCAISLNDAAMHIDEGGCYCVGFGNQCRFEADDCPPIDPT
ncbi:hypothetical protein [Algoriphagus antarcticus]|uniref:Uncharacterized protein n=1 Tax=Algoriphagus antarcticus TaxID=238540 RepID=A0A3E0E2U3_9BACT|nr:hypothetical protein [Algoriphagus antarcticus]REG91970.1 hypothetical protein C8N25_10347 [Algoriphagus antarcticus]